MKTSKPSHTRSEATRSTTRSAALGTTAESNSNAAPGATANAAPGATLEAIPRDEVAANPKPLAPIAPVAPGLTVVSCGPGWIAIDKPPGLSVHNDPETRDVLSLILIQMKADPRLREATKWLPNFAPSPVHRLDRETSGVLLLATDKERATILQKTFEERKTNKIYRAILRRPLSKDAHWTYPLTDRAEGRRDPAGPGPLRKACETSVKVLRSTDHVTEVEIALLTGRQHQIRRHAVLAGHEVIGDGRYGDPKFIKNLEKRLASQIPQTSQSQTLRMMLHARTLELMIGGEPIRLHSPPPCEFEIFFGPQK